MPRMTRRNARSVLSKIADRIESNGDEERVWCLELNELMDALLADDFFGTEGQCDPRGDHRG